MAAKEDETKDEGDEAKGDEARGDEAKGDEAKKPARGTGPTATRQQKKREERMKLIEEQIADGSLKIRQMTPAERKANPPKNLGRKKRRS